MCAPLPPLPQAQTHMHTHSTHSHAHTHGHTHTWTHPYTRTHTQVHTRSNMHTNTRAYTPHEPHSQRSICQTASHHQQPGVGVAQHAAAAQHRAQRRWRQLPKRCRQHGQAAVTAVVGTVQPRMQRRLEGPAGRVVLRELGQLLPQQPRSQAVQQEGLQGSRQAGVPAHLVGISLV